MKGCRDVLRHYANQLNVFLKSLKKLTASSYFERINYKIKVKKFRRLIGFRITLGRQPNPLIKIGLISWHFQTVLQAFSKRYIVNFIKLVFKLTNRSF